MGRLHTIGKIIITVYPNDHQPAHFHAVHPDFELQIEIETLTIMRGNPSPPARRAVMGWAEANIATIKTEWTGSTRVIRCDSRTSAQASKDRAMTEEMPRIETVSIEGSGRLGIKWRGKARKDSVNLPGWIATGGKTLAPLTVPAIFSKASVGNYGAAVVWDDGDLAIDAEHLMLLIDEQKKFDEHDAKRWQRQVGLSNNEVADLFKLSISTWCAYKAGSAEIPSTIAMLCRAMLRDPLLMQAHYRPRINGRPPKRATG